MDILVIIWIVVFIGGRILTSVARKEQRQRYQQPTPLSNDELEYRPTAASQAVTTRPQPRNAGAQEKRNQSARLRQELAKQLRNQAERGQTMASVKDYIERMSGERLDTPAAKRAKQAFIEPAQQQMSTGFDHHEEIDWDNYESDFMADSEWDDDDEDIILEVSDLASLERTTTSVSNAPEQAVKQLLRPDAMKQAIIVSEILAKPKSLRRP